MESVFIPPPSQETPKSSAKEVGTSVAHPSIAELSPSSDDEEPWEPLETVDIPNEKGKKERRGSEGPFKGQMLLKVEEPMHAPVVQV
jgi:hypothetical protein